MDSPFNPNVFDPNSSVDVNLWTVCAGNLFIVVFNEKRLKHSYIFKLYVSCNFGTCRSVNVWPARLADPTYESSILIALSHI